MNTATLIGRVGKTPEIKVFTENKLAQFSLATSRRWKDKDGEKKEATEWHNIVINGKLVEVVEKYVLKGSKLAIIGEIRYRDWEDKEGKKHFITEIHAKEMEMLDEKPKTEEAGQVFSEKTVTVNAPDDGDLPEDDGLPF